jgi:hypothetical protein
MEEIPVKSFTIRLTPALLLAGCAFGNSPRLVAIDPEYAYVDGCVDVALRGSNLGTTAEAAIGGAPITGLVAPANNPELGEHAQDVGFRYDGVAPAAATGQSGYADVTMKVDGKDLTLFKGFYYIACPGSVYVESVGVQSDTTAVGGTIGFVGCNLAATTEVRFLSSVDGSVAATGALTSVCGTARATATIPTLAAGTYYVELAAADGATWGGWCAPSTDTAADTADPCASLFSFTIGG